MRKSRLSVAVPYLVVGMWLGFFSLDGATAQIPSLILPLLLAPSQQESSNTPRPNTASQTTKGLPRNKLLNKNKNQRPNLNNNNDNHYEGDKRRLPSATASYPPQVSMKNFALCNKFQVHNHN